MYRYKITRKLRAEIAAYVAGLIDGEGTITLSRRHANERRQLVVSIASTELSLLRFVLIQTETGKITGYTARMTSMRAEFEQKVLSMSPRSAT